MEQITSLVSMVPQWVYILGAGLVAAFKGKDIWAFVKSLIQTGKVPWDLLDPVDIIRKLMEEMLPVLAVKDPRWQQVIDKLAEVLALIIEIKRNPEPKASSK